MARDDRTQFFRRGSPQTAAMVADLRRAATLTARLNSLTFNDAAQVRALLGELIGADLHSSVLLIPPFHTTSGRNIRLGRNVFINQNCTAYDLGGIAIGDDVMIGPNVSLLTSGHPVDPSRRHAGVTAAPIVIERNVWIAAGAIVVGGVTIGEGSVVAAGAVVTRDVPPNSLVAGNPARVVRSTLESAIAPASEETERP